MKVKIIGCASKQSWYRDKIGEVFDVVNHIGNNQYYELCSDNIYLMHKNECQIIKDDITGLTPQEKIVMDKICDGYNEFLKLETQHPSEQPDFADAIHAVQNILAMRIVRRNYPEYWLIHKNNE